MTGANGASALDLDLMEGKLLLRRLRQLRDAMQLDLLALEERVKAGYNGDLVAAYHAMGGELSILDGIITKLWRLVG